MLYGNLASFWAAKNKANRRPSAGNPKSEYLNPKRVKEDANLKKQSQFSVAHINVNSLEKGDYDKIPLCVAKENKPKQSQFRAHQALKTGRSVHCSSDN